MCPGFYIIVHKFKLISLLCSHYQVNWAGCLGYIIFNKSINQLNNWEFFIKHQLKFKFFFFFPI